MAWWDRLDSDWRTLLLRLLAALVGGVVVLGQGLILGLFGGNDPHAAFHLGSFALNVLFLGQIPAAIFFFVVAEHLPKNFVIEVAAATLAEGLVIVGIAVFGAFRSTDLNLLKFAATVYGLYFVVYALAQRFALARRAVARVLADKPSTSPVDDPSPTGTEPHRGR
jgi:hypothetical protein